MAIIMCMHDHSRDNIRLFGFEVFSKRYARVSW